MADANIFASVLGVLRTFAPLYSFTRTVWRSIRKFTIALARVIFSQNQRIGPPVGFYSGLLLLGRGDVEGRIVLEKQPLPAAPADSLRIRCALGQNGHQPWPIFWLRERNARLVGPSLALRDSSKRLLIEACFGLPFANADPSNHTLYLPPVIRLDGAWTSTINRWGDAFYHWMTDHLPRLALLAEFPSDTRILVPPVLRPYQIDSLEMLGLNGRVRPTEEIHLLVEDYYFSSMTGMTGCDNFYNVTFLRERLLPFAKAMPAHSPKIFVRREGKTRGIKNEAEVVAFFADLGWRIVELEELSLAEQIGIFASAEAVCAVHGAALTNLVWCRSSCVALELLASTFLNGCYEGIAACLGLRYTYLIFPSDGHFRITVDLAIIKHRLKDLGLI